MKSIESWVTSKVLLCCLMLFIVGCNSTDLNTSERCKLPEKNSSKIFFFIDSSFVRDAHCIYRVKSSFFDENSFSGDLLMAGSKVLVDFTKKTNGYEVLFSFEADPGNYNDITIIHRNWKEGKGTEFIEKKYSVILESFFDIQGEKIALLRIPKIITGFPNIGLLDAVIFFSNDEGFIGSYYIDPKEPTEIISKAGNILEEYIDYSNYTFNVIK